MNIPEHGHCEICHRPITMGDRFCGSAECAEKHKLQLREKKKQMWILLLALAAVMLFSVISRI